MTTKWKSKIPEYNVALDAAMKEALEFTATLYELRIKQDLAPGFTSGDFVTGNLVAGVYSEVMKEAGVWVATVRCSDPYGYYWELGHFNIFTRRFERQERWRPLFNQLKGTMKDMIAERLEGVKV